MKNYRMKALLLCALAAVTAFAGPKKTVLSSTITDDAIVYPNSFETDTREMMNNWYLKNYAEIDANVEKKNVAEVSDAEYIRRLNSIPSAVELPFNQVVKSYITRYVVKSRTLVAEILGMGTYYFPIFEQALEKRGMPLELKYIPVIESAMNPNAVSPVGATGLWQFMLGTAKDEGLEVNTLVDERRDPYRSSEIAAEYFKKLYERYHDWSLAIAAYNCGPGNVDKALARAKNSGNSDPDFWAIYNYLPKETRGYVPAFIGATYALTYYKEHNITPALKTRPLMIDTIQVNQRIKFSQIANVLNIPIDEIRILNPQYRQDVIPGNTRPYTLALPSQQIYSYLMVQDSIEHYKAREAEVETESKPVVASVATPVTEEPAAQEKPVKKSSSRSSSSSAAPARSSSYSAASASGSSATGNTSFHKVKQGETVESIAREYGMTSSELMTLNGLNRAHVMRGQVLKVKNGGSSDGASQTAEVPEPKTSSNNDFYAANDGNYQPSSSSEIEHDAGFNDEGAANGVPAGKSKSRENGTGAVPAPKKKATQAQAEVPEPKGSNKTYTSRSVTTDDYEAQQAAERAAAAKQKAKEEAEKKAKEEAARKAAAAKKQKEAAAKKAKEEAAKKAAEEKKAKEEADKKKKDKDDDSKSSKDKKNKKDKDDDSKSSKDKKSKKDKDDDSKSSKDKKNKKDKDDDSKSSKDKKSKKDKDDDSKSSKDKKSKKDKDDDKKAKSNTPSTHSVKEGESLERIARKNGVTTQELKKANPNLKGDLIHPGDKLNVPKNSKKSADKKDTKSNDKSKDDKSSKKDTKSSKSKKK